MLKLYGNIAGYDVVCVPDSVGNTPPLTQYAPGTRISRYPTRHRRRTGIGLCISQLILLRNLQQAELAQNASWMSRYLQSMGCWCTNRLFLLNRKQTHHDVQNWY